MFKLLIPIIVGLLIAVSAHAAQTRTLRIGNQSVTLTSDKRSAPALAVQIDNTVWYGYLVNGTAPGRLTVQMPGGQIHSLTAPPINILNAISADFPRVWTWDQAFRDANPRWGNQNVWWNTEHDNNLSIERWGLARIWPEYHIQATCGTLAGTNAVKGDPGTLPAVSNGTTTFAAANRQCWCRLKQRSDGANGGWVFFWTRSSAAACAYDCPLGCAGDAAVYPAFRSALFDAFNNP